MTNNSALNKLTIVAVAVFVLPLLLPTIMYTVSERELAVVLQFGEPVKSITEPGLNFKMPFVQEVRRLPRTKQVWVSRSQELLVDLPTKDGKKIEVAAWAVWKINDPGRFVRVLRTVENGERAVKDRVRAVIRDVITSYNLSEVVRSSPRELTRSFQFKSEDETNDLQMETPTLPGEIDAITVGREKILAEIKQSIQRRLRGADTESEELAPSGGNVDRGVELVDVGISNIGFTQKAREASFAKWRTFMESIAAGYRNAGEQRKQEILNETRAEVEKIVGMGEQQSNVLRGEVDAENIDAYAEAIKDTGDFYNFIKTLEVYDLALQGDTRLILTTDSELFRLLKQVEPVTATSTNAAP